MTEVIVELRVLPKDVEVDLEKLEKEINSALTPQKILREPVAFGLVALRVTKIVKDEAGQIDELERKLKIIEGVGELEVLKVTRAIY
ncbi:MAG: elongation factor 1-beta [Candidatus Aenigmarchaeota archaeon]|nr:elongation factor 1-beta [Candidatus Aenigmarchaeota archaeon]